MWDRAESLMDTPNNLYTKYAVYTFAETLYCELGIDEFKSPVTN